MATEPGRTTGMAAARRGVALLVVALLSVAACSRAESGEPQILVTEAVATPGDDTVAVYAVFDNAGGEDRLLGAARPDPEPTDQAGPAGTVSLHTTEHRDGLSVMTPVSGIEIGAAAVTRLEPGGPHVMVEELSSPLVEGDSFELTFKFERSTPLTITVEVLGTDEVLDHLHHSEEEHP